MCTYNDVRLHCVLKINNPYTILMNDLKEFPVVLNVVVEIAHEIARITNFVTRVFRSERMRSNREPNNIYLINSPRNSEWRLRRKLDVSGAMDGPVRGNIRSSRAISRFDFSSQIDWIFTIYLFLFLNPLKTILLRNLFFKIFLPRSR